MSDTFDPDERFTVPEGVDPEDVLRRILETGEDDVDPEPEDEQQ